MSKRSSSASQLDEYSPHKIRKREGGALTSSSQEIVLRRRRLGEGDDDDTDIDYDSAKEETEYLAAVLNETTIHGDEVFWSILSDGARRLWFAHHPKATPINDKRRHDCASPTSACTQYKATASLYCNPPFTHDRIRDPSLSHICIISEKKEHFCSNPNGSHDKRARCLQHTQTYFCSITGAIHLCEERCRIATAKSGGTHTDGRFLCPISRATVNSAGQVVVSSKFWRAGQKSEQEMQGDRMTYIHDLREAYGDRTRKTATVDRRLNLIAKQEHIAKTRSVRRELDKFPPLDVWTRDLCHLDTFDAVTKHLDAACTNPMLETFKIADRYHRIVRAAVYRLVCPERGRRETDIDKIAVKHSLTHVDSVIAKSSPARGGSVSMVDIVQAFNNHRKARYFIEGPKLNPKDRQELVEFYSSRIINLWCLLRTHTSTARYIPEAFTISHFSYGALLAIGHGVVDPDLEPGVIIGASEEILRFLPTNTSSVPGFVQEEAIFMRDNIIFAIRNALHHEALDPSIFDDIEPQAFPTSIYHTVTQSKRAPVRVSHQTLNARIVAASKSGSKAKCIGWH